MSNIEISLRVEDFEWLNCWKRVTIKKSLNDISGGMALETVDFEAGNKRLTELRTDVGQMERAVVNDALKDITGLKIEMGAPYNLQIKNLDKKGATVKSISIGYIDQIDMDYNEDGASIIYTGRDKTCDLADCRYEKGIGVKKGFEYQTFESTLDGFVEFLCLPFDIPVTGSQSVISRLQEKRTEKFTGDPGVPIIEVIMRECLKRGIIPVSFGDGKLSLTDSTSAIDTGVLITDSDVKSAKIRMSNLERFSVYTTKGQGVRIPTANGPADYTTIDGTYEDVNIARYRPYIILPEGKVTIKDCENRSKFEANIRAGQSRSLEYTIKGWFIPGTNKMWDINTLVSVRDQIALRNEKMLISELEFNLTPDEGYETKMLLVHKDTYSLRDAIKLMNTGFDINTARGNLKGTR